MQSVTVKDLIDRAKALLADGTVDRVYGWKKGLADYDVTPALFETAEELENEFVVFMKSMDPQDLKAEFLLPKCIDRMLQEQRVQVSVLETQDRWYGITFKEDVEEVREAFRNL
jgi:hypothetical protein